MRNIPPPLNILRMAHRVFQHRPGVPESAGRAQECRLLEVNVLCQSMDSLSIQKSKPGTNGTKKEKGKGG
jgi:hypothetical protein